MKDEGFENGFDMEVIQVATSGQMFLATQNSSLWRKK